MGRDLPRAGDGRIDESVRGVPAPALRPLIAGYAGYRQAGVGLHTSPALITHQGRQSGIQLALSPLGARALLGVPAAELASIDVDGRDVLGRLAGEVCERIRAAADWPGRFAVLGRVLTSRLADPRNRAGGRASDEVRHARRRLVLSGGRCPIADLAAETGGSDRHLRPAFHRETGLTPKSAARVIRFDRARRRLQRQAAGAPPLLAGLAADCGYHDQAHLARELRDLAGCRPSAWLAAEFRNVQAKPAVALPALLS